MDIASLHFVINIFNMFLFLSVLTKVLEKTHHYDGMELKVHLYFDCVGIVPADHDSSILTVPFPRSIDITDQDMEIISFIKDGHMQQIEKTMELSSCRCEVLYGCLTFQLVFKNSMSHVL